MIKSWLFGRLKPGPGGRTIEEPGIIPDWLILAGMGTIAVMFLGLLLWIMAGALFG